MPQEQRYALHSRIISKTETSAAKTDAQTAQNTIRPQHGIDTIIYNAQFNSNLSQEKPDKSVFEVLSALSRWYYRKILRKIKYFRKQNSNVKTDGVFNVKHENPNISDLTGTPAPQKSELPEQLNPSADIIPKDAPVQNYSQKQYPKPFKLIANERFIFAVILSIMFLTIIFLLIKVGKLSRAVEKQNAHIEKSQKAAAVKRVVIRDVPASRIPLSKKKI
jgi:hypothetical protein